MSKESKANKFFNVLSQSVEKSVTVYMRNGKAMSGVVRAFDADTVTIDSTSGVRGGTQVDCNDITTVTVNGR